jgi:hypothetical protein
MWMKYCDREKAVLQKKHGLFRTGSPGGTRTPDKVVNSHLLYQLSYRGKLYGQTGEIPAHYCFSSILLRRPRLGRELISVRLNMV